MICCWYVGSALPSLILSEFVLPLFKRYLLMAVDNQAFFPAMNIDPPLSNDPEVFVPVQNTVPTIRKEKRGSKKKSENTSGNQQLPTLKNLANGLGVKVNDIH